MGVRGFTTYMSNHSHLFLEAFQLKNCYVILDGSGIAINLYHWHTKANDCFGGDYDNYANTVYNFFTILKKCNVTPIILFDGGYENRKLKTVFSRMRNRIGAIKRLNSVTEGSICVFPLFVKELFQDIALELGVKCIRNDYESDSEIACLARNLNCPILGYDSDFYFFDTLYIPFRMFEMKIINTYNKELKKHEYYIPCEVYKVDKFLKHFGGLDKEKIPLLPVLLGNDYIKKSLFSAFHRHLKLKKSRVENEQQRLIKTVICWLRHETLETAISKILGRFKEKKRKLISIKLNGAMQGYLQVNSTLTQYLEDSDQPLIHRKKERNIDILKIQPIFDEEQEEEELEDFSDGGSSGENVEEICDLTNDCDTSIDDSKGPKKIENTSGQNSCFSEKYRRCFLPQCFVDIKMRNTYFCVSQVEDYSEPHSHTISFNILKTIHKILTKPKTRNLVCIARGNETSIRKDVQSQLADDVPDFQEIQNFGDAECKKWFFKILKVDGNYEKFLDLFPSDWHLFLISLYYWKANSKNNVDTSFLYSLILCSLVLNFVDSKVGFCRTSKALSKKFNNIDKLISGDNAQLCNKKSTLTNETEQKESDKSLIYSLDNISCTESLLCLKLLLNYFHMDPKIASNSKLYDVTVVSQFSQFQSSLLHIKYLNSIFNFPFENILVSKFFSGTFLYNLTINFRKRNNLKSYIATLLKDCTSILYSFRMILDYIEQWFGQISDSDAKKTRKRKRKNRKEEPEVTKGQHFDEDDFIDEENMYSLLQNVSFVE